MEPSKRISLQRHQSESAIRNPKKTSHARGGRNTKTASEASKVNEALRPKITPPLQPAPAGPSTLTGRVQNSDHVFSSAVLGFRFARLLEEVDPGKPIPVSIFSENALLALSDTNRAKISSLTLEESVSELPPTPLPNCKTLILKKNFDLAHLLEWARTNLPQVETLDLSHLHSPSGKWGSDEEIHSLENLSKIITSSHISIDTVINLYRRAPKAIEAVKDTFPFAMDKVKTIQADRLSERLSYFPNLEVLDLSNTDLKGAWPEGHSFANIRQAHLKSYQNGLTDALLNALPNLKKIDFADRDSFTEDSKKLPTIHLQLLSEDMVPFVDTSRIPELSLKQMRAVTADQVLAMKTETLLQVTEEQWKYASLEVSVEAAHKRIKKLKDEEITSDLLLKVFGSPATCPLDLAHHLGIEALKELSPRQVELDSFPEETLAFSQEQIQALSNEAIPHIHPSKIALLSVNQMEFVTEKQIQETSDDVFLSITREQWEKVSKTVLQEAVNRIKHSEAIITSDLLIALFGDPNRVPVEFLHHLNPQTLTSLSFVYFSLQLSFPDESKLFSGAQIRSLPKEFATIVHKSKIRSFGIAQMKSLPASTVKGLSDQEIADIGMDQWEEASDNVRSILPARFRSFWKLTTPSKVKVTLRAINALILGSLFIPISLALLFTPFFWRRNTHDLSKRIWSRSLAKVNNIKKWLQGNLRG